jgi:pyruvate/2-oxoglutarate/acetoin dehydrogenase E1 component
MTSVLESLNSRLHQVFAQDERVYLLGEDILDPYGGAFKVSRGLSSAYPWRVLTTPISEAGIVGVAAGMALRGLLPVVEIMFGDFVTLIADQVINHVAKFRWMYNEQVNVPIVIRTPMGGRRGYGPTHSQTLEKLYLGTPGLHVVAPTNLGDPGDLLATAILADAEPVLFIENKLLYPLPVQDNASLTDFNLSTRLDEQLTTGWENIAPAYPTYTLSIRDAPEPILTLVAYGHMAELARQAILRLAYDHEIFVELVVPTQLSPFKMEAILTSARRTGRLLAAEEGTRTAGWGAEILSRTVEATGTDLKAGDRLAARDLPIPASGPLEAAVIPGVEEIIQTARMMV